MTEEIFVQELNKLGIKVNKEQLFMLEKYYEKLIEYNKKINLTAITEKEEVYLKHFYDSLTIVKSVDLSQVKKLCDVGSGAGFPGVVLKIFFPDLEVSLVDSLNKRVKFLNELVKELKLSKIVATHARMEDFSKKHIEEYDLITARAVANTAILAEISVQALKIGGKLIFLKGKLTTELDDSLEHIKKLNLKLLGTKSFLLAIENSQRNIVSFEKIARTKKKYPRTVSQIKRELNL